MNIEIKEINTLNGFAVVRDHWNEFVKTEAPDRWFFFSYDWFATWLKVFGKHVRPVILMAYQDNKLCGIAPLCFRKMFYLGVYVPVLRIIENEYSVKNSIIVKNNDYQILSRLLDTILDKYNRALIYFKDISKKDEINQKIIDYCNKQELDYKERIARCSLSIKLEENWERYLNTRSVNFRKKLKNVEKRINNFREVKVIKYESESTLKECFCKLKEIARNSWQGRQNSSLASNKTLSEFYYKIACIAAQNDMLKIWVCERQGNPLAYLYDIHIGEKIYSLKKEFNDKYRYYNPGIYLDMESAKQAFMKNYKEMDLLGYYTSDKARWATEMAEDSRIFIYNGLSAKLVKFVDFNIRNMVKRLLRREKI